ncbi:MAG: ATP synthase F1 subunit delta [Clostridiales bacterium]|nr:ATP synthase F1 subunit delta [Clostridiales bacterium]
MTDMSKAYADALFSLALETNTVYDTLMALKEMRNGIYATQGAMDLLASPSIPKDERCAVLEKAFGDVEPAHVMSFVGVLVQHGHIRELDDCLQAYTELHDEYCRLSTAYVTSAIELTAKEKAELTEKLSRKFQRTIHLECAVDPSLLGGLVVRVDSKVIDGSLKHRLHEIKEVMNR